jgi:hypothetical protein
LFATTKAKQLECQETRRCHYGSEEENLQLWGNDVPNEIYRPMGADAEFYKGEYQ